MSKKKTNQDVDRAFNAEGYTRLSDYLGRENLIEFICPNGHKYQISWHGWTHGYRCGICHDEKTRSTNQDVDRAFNAEGYERLSDYKNNKESIKIRCPKKHEHYISWNQWKSQGTRCGVCFDEKYGDLFANGKAYKQITGTIKCEIKRCKLFHHWSKFYPPHHVKEIAKSIESFYQACPKGCHIDHIVPVTWFDLFDEDNLKYCWDIRNLRYLPGVENKSRGNKMTLEEFKMMCYDHPEIINNCAYADDRIKTHFK